MGIHVLLEVISTLEHVSLEEMSYWRITCLFGAYLLLIIHFTGGLLKNYSSIHL